MGVLDYFKSVPTMSADEVKKFLSSKKPDEYNLVDVRLPVEYEEDHLPGANLIPMAELKDRIAEIDPNKPTITYWTAGVRSRSAASFLLGAGLKNVYSMGGGIRAWKGMVAHGEPEAGMAYFPPAANAEEIVGLAWSLEEGSKLYYQGVADYFSDDAEARKIFEGLVVAEKNHEQHLLETYQQLTGTQPDFSTLKEKFHDSLGGAFMEGAIKVEDGLAWVKDKGVVESLELAMSMEVNAYDLYIKMSRAIKDKQAQQIFKKLSEEEQLHLKRLSGLLDRRV